MAKKRVKKRTVRLVRPAQKEPGVFAIAEGRKLSFYYFREIASEIGGRGFAVLRLGTTTAYHVRLVSPNDSTCECLGFLRLGRCKHVQALQALLGQGLLK